MTVERLSRQGGSGLNSGGISGSIKAIVTRDPGLAYFSKPGVNEEGRRAGKPHAGSRPEKDWLPAGYGHRRSGSGRLMLVWKGATAGVRHQKDSQHLYIIHLIHISTSVKGSGYSVAE